MSNRLGGSSQYQQVYVQNANITAVRCKTLTTPILQTTCTAAQYGYVGGNSAATPIKLFVVNPGEIGTVAFTSNSLTNGGFGGTFAYSYFNSTGATATLVSSIGGGTSTPAISIASGGDGFMYVFATNNGLSMLWRKMRIN